MRNVYRNLSVVVFMLLGLISSAQQEANYTQYMYNTLIINPGYTGSREALSIVGLHRSQWVGIEGAPETQTLGIHSLLNDKSNLGVGLSIIRDVLGISEEFYFEGNVSYSIKFKSDTKLSFGIRGGGQSLKVDYTKGTFRSPDGLNNRITTQFAPTLGFGMYYFNSDKWYAGVSTNNFLKSKHVSLNEEYMKVSEAQEEVHFYLIGGYIFNLSDSFKLKPATLMKLVSGAPPAIDISLSSLIADRFNVGVAYRLANTISGLAGFQATPQLLIGYSYDSMLASDIAKYTSGSHEVFLRYEFGSGGKSGERIKSPRFF